MEFNVFVFWVLALMLVGSSLRVITAKNSVHSALYLVLAFFNAAGVWMLLQAEFLAISLVLVYVGAVTVLFLFVLMMLDINYDKMREGFHANLPLAFGVGAVVVVEMSMVLWTKVADTASKAPAAADPGYSNTKVLGRVIYTQYVYAVEIAAVLLLVAIVAAIALTLRKRKQTKYQSPSQQINVRREDRVRLVNLPSVKPDGSGN
ncbi:MAG: NADH-quinone oxidoreductase subunit J [Casimicrobiaceae bacterium]